MMKEPENSVFARATRDIAYGRDVVILSDDDCSGRSHPITQTAVDLHVHAHKDHDPKQVAEAVHRRFNEAAASQLHDGIYG